MIKKLSKILSVLAITAMLVIPTTVQATTNYVTCPVTGDQHDYYYNTTYATVTYSTAPCNGHIIDGYLHTCYISVRTTSTPGACPCGLTNTKVSVSKIHITS
jgi:hypothetical protein